MRKLNGKSNVFGKVIEKYRIARNMSREDLAQKLQLSGLNIDRTHILRIEKRQVILKDFELITICEILNIGYTDLKEELYKNED